MFLIEDADFQNPAIFHLDNRQHAGNLPTYQSSNAGFRVFYFGKFRIGLHLANLAEMPFVVGGGEEQPLVRVERTER